MRASQNAVRKMSALKRNKRRVAKLRLESLEPRTMLSAAPSPAGLICRPNLSVFAGAGPSALTPAQIRHAYGFDQITWYGGGQTIAIVDANDDPTVAADLHAFDQQFGLVDPPKLTVAKLSMFGLNPVYDPLWAMEISLDVEWAHAIAPRANILLVEAPSASLGALVDAVDYARRQVGVGVVSMSWGSPEFSTEGFYDSYFTTPAGHGGVTFIASSGDSGAPASWPSISSNVLSVGGTMLSLGSGGSYGGESAWSRGGGGYSPYVLEPNYQRGVQNTGQRSNPDVAYDGDPASGFSIYENGAWYAVGGTSAGAPQWAGLIALANQQRVATGRPRLTSALSAIYSLPSADFHDVTTGNNDYAAGVGYDAATGRGSPIAKLVVRDLVAYRQTAVTAIASAAPTTLPTPSSLTVGQSIETLGCVANEGLAPPVQTASGPTAAFPAEVEYIAAPSTRVAELSSTTATAIADWPVGGRIATAFVGVRWTTSSVEDVQLVDSAGADQTSASTNGEWRTAENHADTPAIDGIDRSAEDAVSPRQSLICIERLFAGDFESDAAVRSADDRSLQQDLIDACLETMPSVA